MVGEFEMLPVLCFLPYEDNIGTFPVTGSHPFLPLPPFLVPLNLLDEAKRCGDAGTTGPTEVAIGTPATCAASLGMLRRS